MPIFATRSVSFCTFDPMAGDIGAIITAYNKAITESLFLLYEGGNINFKYDIHYTLHARQIYVSGSLLLGTIPPLISCQIVLTLVAPMPFRPWIRLFLATGCSVLLSWALANSAFSPDNTWGRGLHSFPGLYFPSVLSVISSVLRALLFSIAQRGNLALSGHTASSSYSTRQANPFR